MHKIERDVSGYGGTPTYACERKIVNNKTPNRSWIPKHPIDDLACSMALECWLTVGSWMECSGKGNGWLASSTKPLRAATFYLQVPLTYWHFPHNIYQMWAWFLPWLELNTGERETEALNNMNRAMINKKSRFNPRSLKLNLGACFQWQSSALVVLSLWGVLFPHPSVDLVLLLHTLSSGLRDQKM